MNINAFRAYFQLNNGLTAGDITNGARLFFGDNDDATGIKVMSDVRSKMSDVWHDLSGRKFQSKPTAKGVYIYNGKKKVLLK